MRHASSGAAAAGSAAVVATRRSVLAMQRAAFAILLLLATAAGWAGASQAAGGRVAAVGLTVGDMDRAVAFYTEVLRCEKLSDVEVWGDEQEHLRGLFGLRARVVRLRLGDEIVELTDYLTAGGRPLPVDSHSNDRWFQHAAIVVSDMDRAYRWLRAHGVVHGSTGPQRLPDWNPNAGGIQAFYFRDPDDHNIEVIWFPAGKGDPRWQTLAAAASKHATAGEGMTGDDGRGIFLGIDHTAIVVGDTEESLRFYRDALGMRVAGHSESWGTEQEHLNNVFGARLRITALRVESGPGIELLEYLTPRDGRPYPADARADDLLRWSTVVVRADLDAVMERLQAAGYSFVSPGVVSLRDGALGFGKGFQVRDPDGHVMEVVDTWQTPPSSAAVR